MSEGFVHLARRMAEPTREDIDALVVGIQKVKEVLAV